MLHIRVVGVELVLDLSLLLFWLLGVRLVGVLPLAEGFENARGVPFGKLDLLENFGFRLAPLVKKVEEGGSRVERVGRLSDRRQ